MSKPIFILQIGLQIDAERAAEIKTYIESKLPDYHVFVIQSEKTQAQVFNPSEIEPKSIEEIKELLKL